MGLLSMVRLIPGAGNALTWLGAFKGPCLILALVAALLAGGVSGTVMWKLRGSVDDGRVARAEKEIADWKAAAAQARIDANTRVDKIMADAKGVHDEQMESIHGLAADIQRLAGGVRDLSGYVSTLRLSEPATGSAKPIEGGEPRAACSVLQELAAEFALRADINAAEFNSLMERWEKIASESAPKE